MVRRVLHIIREEAKQEQYDEAKPGSFTQPANQEGPEAARNQVRGGVRWGGGRHRCGQQLVLGSLALALVLVLGSLALALVLVLGSWQWRWCGCWVPGAGADAGEPPHGGPALALPGRVMASWIYMDNVGRNG